MSVEKHTTATGLVSYRVRVDLPADAVTGRRRQRMKTVRTKKEAEALERQALQSDLHRVGDSYID